MKRLLLISDNHGDEQVVKNILKNEQYDISVHLGDSLQPEKLIKKQFDIYVSGNNEIFSIFEEDKEIEGFRIIIIHGHTANIIDNHEDWGHEFAKARNADILLFGHTHTPCNKDINGIRFINPGSVSFPRNNSLKSYAILELENKKILNVIFKNL